MRFVTRKIIHAVASLAMGNDVKLSLGNLEIERDWGWAPEYVQAIAMMLEKPSPQDYIIATGRSHTLTQFVETAFSLIGKDWRPHVTIDPYLMRPADILRSKVDPSNALSCLGWKAENGIKEVVGMMLDAEIKKLREQHLA
jgi:GDPmannose 4,6-dehydratase